MKRLLVILAVLVGLTLVGGCGPTTTTEPTPSVYRVAYRITGQGSKRGSITYNNEGGNTEQQPVSIPWFSEVYTVNPDYLAYISVQNAGKAGNVTCEILVNGEVAESATSRGAYAVATCSGKVE